MQISTLKILAELVLPFIKRQLPIRWGIVPMLSKDNEYLGVSHVYTADGVKAHLDCRTLRLVTSALALRALVEGAGRTKTLALISEVMDTTSCLPRALKGVVLPSVCTIARPNDRTGPFPGPDGANFDRVDWRGMAPGFQTDTFALVRFGGGSSHDATHEGLRHSARCTRACRYDLRQRGSISSR